MSKQKYIWLTCSVIVLVLAQVACSVFGFQISRGGGQPSTSSPVEAPTSSSGQPASTSVVPPLGQVPAPKAGTGNVTGRVFWNGQPVAGQEVMLCEEVKSLGGCQGAQYSATTDSSGQYVITEVAPGEYAMVVRALDVDNWLYITAGLGFSTLKYSVTAGQTLTVGDQSIHKFDLRQTYPAEDENINELTPTLKWDAYHAAAYYEVYLVEEGGNEIFLGQNTVENEFTLPNPLHACKFTWQVEAFNAQRVKIAEQNGYSHFNVVNQTILCYQPLKYYYQAPTRYLMIVTKPLDGASVTGIGLSLSWEAHPMAAHYVAVVFKERWGGDNLLDYAQVNGTSFTLRKSLAEGKYVWLVSAYNQSGDAIAGSVLNSFTVTGP